MNENNIDSIFKMSSKDPEDKDPKARYLDLISAVKCDNMHANLRQKDSDHVYLQPRQLEAKNALGRIIRFNQQYKVDLQHALNTNNRSFNLLEKINRIDYL